MSETSSSVSADRISPNTNTNDHLISTPSTSSGLPSSSTTPSLNPQSESVMDDAGDSTTFPSSSLPSTSSLTTTTSTTSVPSSLSNSKITAYIHPKLLSKRPTKPFLIFMKDKRDFYRAKMESDSSMSTNINAVLGEAWQNLGPTERAFYQQQYTDETNAFNSRLTDLGVPSSARVVLEPPPNGQDIWLASDDDIKAISKERSSSMSSSSTFPSTTSGLSTGSILGSSTSSRPVTKRGRAGTGAISMERAIRLRDHGESSLPHEIPVQKVRSLVTAIPGISVISTETASLIARAGEEFLLYFAERMLTSATEKRRRTLVYDDVRRAIRAEKSLQFLRVPFFAEAGPDAPDVVPNFDMTSAELALADRNANSGMLSSTSGSVPISVGPTSSKKGSSRNNPNSASKKEPRGDISGSLEAGVSRETSEMGEQSGIDGTEEGERETISTSTVPKPRSRAPKSKSAAATDKSKTSLTGGDDSGLNATSEGTSTAPKLSSRATKSPARPRGKNASNALSDTASARLPTQSMQSTGGEMGDGTSSTVTEQESPASGTAVTKKPSAPRKREARPSKKVSEQTTEKEAASKGSEDVKVMAMTAMASDSSSYRAPMVDAIQQHAAYSADISSLTTFPLSSIPSTTASLTPMVGSDTSSHDSQTYAYGIDHKHNTYYSISAVNENLSDARTSGAVPAGESSESTMPLHMQMQMRPQQIQPQMQMRPDQLSASTAVYTNFSLPLHHVAQGSQPIYTDIPAGMTNSSLTSGQSQYQYDSSANIAYHYSQNDIPVSHFQTQIQSPSHETVAGQSRQSAVPILNSPFLYSDASTLASALPDSTSNASHGNSASAPGMYSGAFQSLDVQQQHQQQQQYATYDGSHVYQAQPQGGQDQDHDVERNQHFSEVQYPSHDHGHMQALPQQYNGASSEGALYISPPSVDIYGNVATHQEYQQQQYQAHYTPSDSTHYDYQQQQQQQQSQSQQQQQQ